MNTVKKQLTQWIAIILLSLTLLVTSMACSEGDQDTDKGAEQPIPPIRIAATLPPTSETVVQADQDQIEAYIEQGMIYLEEEHEYELAISEFDKALEMDPDNVKALTQRGRAYLALGDEDQALEEFNKASELDISGPKALLADGRVHFERHEYEQALDDFNEALELAPNSGRVLSERGLTHFYLRDYDSALTDLDQAISVHPTNSLAYSYRGYVYEFGLDESTLALADYDKAIELDPGRAGYYNVRGYIYRNQGLYPEAIADLEKAVELEPDSAEYSLMLGEIYRTKGEYDRALDTFNDSITKGGPNYYKGYASYGMTYRLLGELDKALIALDKAIEINSDYDVSYHHRGQVHIQQNNFEEAIADFDQVIALNPWDTSQQGYPAKSLFAAYLGKSIAYSFLGDFETALTNFDLASQLDLDEQDLGAAPYMLCRMGSLMEHPNAILSECDQAVAMFSQEGNMTYDARAIIKALSGDNSGAIADFETYLDWARENNIDAEQIVQREQWIAALVADENPFEFTLLEQVAMQAFEAWKDGTKYDEVNTTLDN